MYDSHDKTKELFPHLSGTLDALRDTLLELEAIATPQVSEWLRKFPRQVPAARVLGPWMTMGLSSGEPRTQRFSLLGPVATVESADSWLSGSVHIHKPRNVGFTTMYSSGVAGMRFGSGPAFTVSGAQVEFSRRGVVGLTRDDIIRRVLVPNPSVWDDVSLPDEDRFSYERIAGTGPEEDARDAATGRWHWFAVDPSDPSRRASGYARTEALAHAGAEAKLREWGFAFE